jgi:hypothetical protein
LLLGRGQGVEEGLLGGPGDRAQSIDEPLAGGGEGDPVAAPIAGVTFTGHQRAAFEVVDAADCLGRCCRMADQPGPLEQRKLGALSVPALGLGCMGMTSF